jgi:signal transduction histidine kinase
MAGPDGEVTPSAGDLQRGFAAFVDAARQLEHSYAELKARAEAVDLELQQTNLRLAQALAERDAILAALPLGVVALDTGGAVTFRNGEAARLCALAAGHGVDLCAAPTGDVAIGGGAARVRRAGVPDGALVLIEDRSRIHELEREVHRLDRLAGLSELALGVAHEIKNPLNGAMGFAALIERAPDAGAVRRHAERVREGLAQVDAIVKSLLAFARPDRGRVAVAALGAVVGEAAASAGLPASRVRLDGDAALPVESGALLRVLSVLFCNAREAAGGAASVRVAASGDAGRLELLVEDDGPGVPAALGDRVFEPFVSTKERGTGLGLPLAARVLAFLGGDLALLNPGRPGARFRVRMPLPASAPAPAEATA